MSGSLRAVLIVGASAPLRSERARAVIDAHAGASGLALWSEGDPSRWPFLRDPRPALAEPAAVLVDGVEAAFPDHQSGGTRLVLTQSGYQMQRLVDRLDTHGGLLVVTADAAALQRKAPEALRGRGPWRRFERIDLGETAPEALPLVRPEPKNELEGLLRLAFETDDPKLRWDTCRRAADLDARSPVVKLCFASAAMEIDRTDAAKDALEQAAKAAPEWEAVHYERGKLFLRTDEMELAERAFAQAVSCMPSFVSGLANWGATLGELDRGNEAVKAFEQALVLDPESPQLWNNMGVLLRESGRLPESEAAHRRVIELDPQFVFGHYNLGHALFLAGRFEAALAAYLEGQRLDPARERRQWARLALARLAAGDDGAAGELRKALDGVSLAEAAEIRAEALEVVTALLVLKPELEQGRTVLELLRAPLRGGA